jgi:CO dehydrogenase maturation factor
VADDADVSFLLDEAGDALTTYLPFEPAVRALEQGRAFALEDLSQRTLDSLAALRAALDEQERDWAKHTRQAVEFHLRNARAWANAAVGEDLAAQVDPDFILTPLDDHRARARAISSR